MQPQTPRVVRSHEAGAVDAAVNALKRGGLVVIPTDTVYGVAADPRVPGAGERLVAAKGREPDKPIPLLAASLAAVEGYGAALGPSERALAARFWPGALTMVLRLRDGREEGFRVPAHSVALAVLTASGGILRVTSANRSGEAESLTAAEAADALGASVDVVLDDGPAARGRPSTVVRVEGGTIRILREGAVAAGALLREQAGP